MAQLTPVTAAPIDATATTSSYQWSGDLGVPSKLAGASLPSGKKFLVLYQLSFGAVNASAVTSVALILNRVLDGTADRGLCELEGEDHGTPEAQRCGHVEGFFVHTGTGQDLEFAWKTYSGVQFWVRSSVPMVAIPLDQTGATLVEGTDYWLAQETLTDGYTALGTTQTAWVDLQTKTVDVAEAGVYLLLAMAEASPDTVGNSAMFRVQIDGVTAKREPQRECEDTRDWMNYFQAMGVNLSAGTHTIKVQGAGLGTGFKDFYRARIFLARGSKFDQFVRTATVGTVGVDQEYPSFDPIVSETYTPNQAEDVLVIGSSVAYRTNSGNTISRLRDVTGGAISEFSSDVNTSHVDADRHTQTCFAVRSVTGGRIFSLETAGEAGAGILPGTVNCLDPEILAISLTLKAAAPPDFSGQIDDSLPMTENYRTTPQGTISDTMALSEAFPLESPAGQFADLLTMVESMSGQVLQGQGTVPLSHPRVWLTAARLAALRTDAGYDDSGVQVNPPGSTMWQNFLNTIPSGGRDAFHYVLLYKVRQTAADKTAAMNDVEAIIADAETNGLDLGDSSYLNYSDYMRDVALCLDWLWDELPQATRDRWQNFLDAATFVCWNEDSESNAIYDDSNWATNTPTQNYYPQKLLGTTYVAMATYWERRQYFTWNGVQHQNRWVFNNFDSGSPTYPWDQLTQYVVDKIRNQGNLMWDKYCEGGAWVEGANYSRAAKRHLGEMLSILLDTAGIDYWNEAGRSWMRDTARYHMYYIQPGAGALYPDGDISSGNTKGNPNQYDRLMMMYVAWGARGSIESQYAQWYLQNVQTSLYVPGSQISATLVWDFLLYRGSMTGLPARDPALDLPRYHYARGNAWVASRDSVFGATAVGVYCHAQDMFQGHQHRDALAVDFYRGKGGGTDDWTCSEVQPFGVNATAYRASDFHNTLIVDGVGQRFQPNGPGEFPEVGKISRFLASSSHTYVLMDASDAYWTNPGSYSHGDQKMTEHVSRGVLHVVPANYVVVHTRVKLAAAFAGSLVEEFWHFPKLQPTVVGDLLTADNGTNRHRLKIISPAGYSIAWLDEQPSGPDTWRASIRNGASAQVQHRLTVHRVQSTSGTMDATASVVSASGNMRGVLIQSATPQTLAMFSADEAGASPISTQYAYAEPGSGICTNYVSDLKPGVSYAVVTSATAGTRTVQITEGAGSITLFADAAGCLIFDPAALVPFTGVSGSFSDSCPLVESFLTTPKETLGESLAMVENYSGNPIFQPTETFGDTMALTEAYRETPGGVMPEALALTENYRTTPRGTEVETLSMTEAWAGNVLPGPPPIPPKPGKRKGKIDRIVEFLDHRIDRGGEL